VRILDRLDFHYSKKSNEVWLMTIMFAVIIGYLIYTLLSPIVSSYRKREYKIYNDLTMKINSANSFLRDITISGNRDYIVKKLNKKITKKRAELNTYKDKLTKLNKAITQLSSVLYTKDNWSKYLHNIAAKARDNNIKVKNITNTVLEQNQTFGKILDIHITSQGRYGDILAFMNDLEKTDLISNITNVKLRATKSYPVADINLSIWGNMP